MNTLLIILSLICFVLAVCGVPVKVNLVALGLAFYMIALLVGAWIR